MVNKRAHKYRKGENAIVLKKNIDSVSHLVKNICRTLRLGKEKENLAVNPKDPLPEDSKILPQKIAPPTPEASKNPLLNCIGNLLKQIDKCAIQQAGDFLSKALEATVNITIYKNI